MNQLNDEVEELARRIRAHSLHMVNRTKASHIGTCLSMADILAVLYGRILRVRSDEPTWQQRDRLLVDRKSVV